LEINLTKEQTNFIRVIAILLIINSHIDSLIPIPFISTGGSLGNALFFVLSGYGLMLSQDENKLNFSKWIVKRLGKIYATIFIFNFILFIPLSIYFKTINHWDLKTILDIFLFPSAFVFIQVLIIFYIIGHPIISYFSQRAIKFTLFLSLISHLLIYIFTTEKSSFNIFSYNNIPLLILGWLSLFVFGIYLGKSKIFSRVNYHKKYVGTLLVVLILIFGQKFLIYKNILVSTQIIQYYLLFAFCYLLMLCSKSIKFKNNKINNIIKFISSITLELYLVHVTLLASFRFETLKFPLGILALISITLLIASIISRLKKFILKT